MKAKIMNFLFVILCPTPSTVSSFPLCEIVLRKVVPSVKYYTNIISISSLPLVRLNSSNFPWGKRKVSKVCKKLMGFENE